MNTKTTVLFFLFVAGSNSIFSVNFALVVRPATMLVAMLASSENNCLKKSGFDVVAVCDLFRAKICQENQTPRIECYWDCESILSHLCSKKPGMFLDDSGFCYRCSSDIE
jgi:hypothetical protein